MKFETAHDVLDGVPYLITDQARALYKFVLKKKPKRCLELGFAHGVSVCYVAAALDEIGEGHIDAVDLSMGREWQKPSIEDLLGQLGLQHIVNVEREQLSYTWFLKKKIEQQSNDYGCTPIYDFCFIDGPKNWTVDGAAFFMVDKLLKQGGHILFDDMSWTYADAAEWSAQKLAECGIHIDRMDDDERSEAHVMSIFKLLVMQHPDYANFEFVDNNWGWAQKTKTAKRTLTVKETAPFSSAVKWRIKALLGRS